MHTNSERAYVFGNHNHLVGVANCPPASQRDVAMIMVTPGMLHSAGPFRLHVQLARRLAAIGCASFRFDLSGIGESLAVGASGTSLQRAAAEIDQAMDLIQTEYGIGKFILFGLCSGADDAFYAAAHDRRVQGLVMVDGCGYRTPSYFWHRAVRHYVPRMVSGRFWRRWMQQRWASAGQTPASLQLGTDIREFPKRKVAAERLQALVDRGVNIRCIYTGGVSSYFNHAGQFDRMFCDVNMRGRVSTAYFPCLDHVALLREDRNQLLSDVVNWTNGISAPNRTESAVVFDMAYAARIRTGGTSPAWGL